MSGMSPYQRKGSPYWSVRRYIRGIGELRLSTGTKSAARARQYDQLILDLKELGRLDALQALRSGHVSLAELYSNKLPGQLDSLLARGTSPELYPLVEEWLTVGADDTGIRDRSMKRYATSWRQFWELLPRSARLGDVTQGFVSEFKRHRQAQAKALGKALSPATLNRDLAALGAFLTWCTEEKGLKVERPTLKYQRESRGRMRWLSREELTAFQQHCPREWWPLFGLLFGTGMTISEALGLRRTDVDLRSRRLSIHEEYGRKLKRESRTRELSIPEVLVPVLGDWFAGRVERQDERIFAFTYWPARKAWAATCKAADIYGATIHDARHTFAVHAVQHGVPEARLQKLLGHSHPGTTRRYAMHSPEQYLEQDAERVSRSMGFSEGKPRLERMA
jgi:integrase